MASHRPALRHPFKGEVEARQNEQREQRRQDQTADDDGRDAALHVAADAGRRAPPATSRWSRPSRSSAPGGSAPLAPAIIASRSEAPVSRIRLRFATMMMPFCTATPNRAMKPTAVATLSVSPVMKSASKSAQGGERHDAEDQQRLTQLAELGVAATGSSSPSTRPRISVKLAPARAAGSRTARHIRGDTWTVIELHRLRDPLLSPRPDRRPDRGPARSMRTVRLRWLFSRVIVLSPLRCCDGWRPGTAEPARRWNWSAADCRALPDRRASSTGKRTVTS